MLEGITRGKDLSRFFYSEQNCIKFLELKRWNGSPVCHICGANASVTGLGRYRCRGKCRAKFKVTTGTIFENSSLPLSDWFDVIYEYVLTYTPTRCIEDRYGVGSETAWNMHQKIMSLFGSDNSDRVGVIGVFEFDEVHCGPDGSRMNRDLKVKKGIKAGVGHCIKILVLYNRLTKEIFGEVLPKKAPAGYIEEKIKLYVHPHSTAYSDAAKYYSGLENYFKEYKQFIHSEYTYGDGHGGHTNSVEGAFKDWRTMERVYGKMSPNHLQRYFDEFCWRYNCRSKGMNSIQMFEHAFKNINRKMTVVEIIKDGKEQKAEIFKRMKGKPATF